MTCVHSHSTLDMFSAGEGGAGCPFLFVFINTMLIFSVHCPIPLINPCWETGDSMNGATSKLNSSTNTCQNPVTSGHMPE